MRRPLRCWEAPRGACLALCGGAAAAETCLLMPVLPETDKLAGTVGCVLDGEAPCTPVTPVRVGALSRQRDVMRSELSAVRNNIGSYGSRESAVLRTRGSAVCAGALLGNWAAFTGRQAATFRACWENVEQCQFSCIAVTVLWQVGPRAGAQCRLSIRGRFRCRLATVAHAHAVVELT